MLDSCMTWIMNVSRSSIVRRTYHSGSDNPAIEERGRPGGKVGDEEMER